MWRRSRSEILSFSLAFLTVQPASWISSMMSCSHHMKISGHICLWCAVQQEITKNSSSSTWSSPLLSSSNSSWSLLFTWQNGNIFRIFLEYLFYCYCATWNMKWHNSASHPERACSLPRSFYAELYFCNIYANMKNYGRVFYHVTQIFWPLPASTALMCSTTDLMSISPSSFVSILL